MGGINESAMRSGRDNFLTNLGISGFEGGFCLMYASKWHVSIVLQLDSSFGCCFCLELGSVKEWTSGGLVSIADVTSGLQPRSVTCLG